MRILLILIYSSFLFLMSCHCSKPIEAKVKKQKNNHSSSMLNENNWAGIWLLIELDGKKLKGSDITLEVQVGEKRLSGKSGCNTYSTSYKIEKNSIILSPIMQTRMYCHNANLETEYTKAFSSTSKFYTQDMMLILFGNNHKLIFKKIDE